MNDTQKMMINIAQEMLADNKEKTLDKIEETLNQIIKMSVFSGLDNKQIKEVRKEILARNEVQMEKGFFIEDKNKKHTPWFVANKANYNLNYWERYRQYLLSDKGFSPIVVNTMDDVLDNITDLLGNPKNDSSYQRRGLVLGDVQSGKTANYTGLICKAADVGYKVIILLTGTIEKLRQQTQHRLDEGFVGRDSDALLKKKAEIESGVSRYNPSVHPMVLTSVSDDFKTHNARNLGLDLNNVYGSVLFVIKKNVKVLKQLDNWLCTFNMNNNKINQTLLMIDDESDNASINTNKEGEDPTSTNKLITKLLEDFSKASYVGFTATPFANIFIDPETNEKMKIENLFPKDYIYSLDSPSNYTGARNIFSENGDDNYMIQEINTHEIERIECLPAKHKKDHIIEFIPEDMQNAINTFLLANVIRDLSMDNIKAHRSMLINVSRFRDVQDRLEKLVNNYLKSIQNTLRLNQKKPYESVKNDPVIKKLKSVYETVYKNNNIPWGEIYKNLFTSTAMIKTVIVNMNHPGSLDYETNEENGLRVIVIGGLSLSRGLTLEGLMVSYIYRNSKTYDTLMQMGRWFGYKDPYKKLCRIWMSEESIDWYQHISDATDELISDIKRFSDTNLTPLDFGLRVRSDINTLDITSRNKMRTAEKTVFYTNLSGEVVETPQILVDKNINRDNLSVIERFIKNVNSDIYHYKGIGNKKIKKGYIDVPKENIINFLTNIFVSPTETKFDTEVLKNFIENYKGTELDYWDVYFPEGNSSQIEITKQLILKKVQRQFSLKSNDRIACISGSKQRLGSKADGVFNLKRKQLDEVQRKVNEEFNKSYRRSNQVNQKDYFRYLQRNPLLSIYFIELTKNRGIDNQDKAESVKNILNESVPLIGFSIGIPRLPKANTANNRATYVINKVEQKIQLEKLDLSFDDEDFGDEEE